MKFGPEIDGLRAVAVVPVILFHDGALPFEGAYVGVDVFVVISGYLIASVIPAEHEAGTVPIAKFNERRATRNLPTPFVSWERANILLANADEHIVFL
jgi:peptidoglycan/LPS O-acetylase OafA/YrhL